MTDMAAASTPAHASSSDIAALLAGTSYGEKAALFGLDNNTPNRSSLSSSLLTGHTHHAQVSDEEEPEGDDVVATEKDGSNASYGDLPSSMHTTVSTNNNSPSPSAGTTSFLPNAGSNNSGSNININTLGGGTAGDFSRMQAVPFRLQSVPTPSSSSATSPLPTPTTPSNPSMSNIMLQQQQQQQQQQPQHNAFGGNNQLVPLNPLEGQTHIDITPYLHLPQTEAAKKLGMPTSTLSKRWKEAVVNNRKWPYRAVTKLDKEIMTLLHNIPQGPGAPPLPAEIERTLGFLLKKRQEELKTVIIRI